MKLHRVAYTAEGSSWVTVKRASYNEPGLFPLLSAPMSVVLQGRVLKIHIHWCIRKASLTPTALVEIDGTGLTQLLP